MIIVFAMYLSVATAASDTSAHDPIQQQPAAKKSQSGQKQLICKSEPVLGSRIKVKRTCLSREDWRFQAEQANDALNEVSRDR